VLPLPLRIVADENMPGLAMFDALGTVVARPGRALSARDLSQTDVLLVRSVTRVDEALLAGTPVRFVGSATIGTDHIDLSWLVKAGIGFAHAPGCNAMAVAEYTLQAVLEWLIVNGRGVNGLTVGVVGCGNVGSRVAVLMRALGATVLCCDPPRQKRGEQVDGGWQSLDAALGCDIVSLHVPLNRDGEDATWHLLDRARLRALTPRQLLINTCRGPVVDNQALIELSRQQLPALVLDVWENEPLLLPDLFDRVLRGSPHIAGYSVEGRWRGSRMVLQGLRRWLGQDDVGSEPDPLQSGWLQPVSGLADLLALLRSRYRLADDHQALAASLSEPEPGKAFDLLRKQYPQRHEMRGAVVRAPVAASLLPLLSVLGVSVWPGTASAGQDPHRHGGSSPR
jgi:erythronate-4-phosphate dehydrogenase